MTPQISPRQLILTAVFLAVQGSIVQSAFGAVPAQFIGRLYTEALGRAPDEPGVPYSGWDYYTAQFAGGCTPSTLTSVAQTVYGSQEYLGLYGNTVATDKRRAKIITLFRGLLSREPSATEMTTYSSSTWDTSTPSGMSAIVAAITGDPDAGFGALVSSICPAGPSAAGPYFWNEGYAPLATGSPTMTTSQLQGYLNARSTDESYGPLSTPRDYSLDPYTLVSATATIVVPCNVTLRTAGVTSRQQYALMARIVRDSSFRAPAQQPPLGSTDRPFAQSPVVTVCGGLQNVWVDGQRARNQYDAPLPESSPPSPPINETEKLNRALAEPNVVVDTWVHYGGGDHESAVGLPKVVDSRLTDASGASNIYVGENNYKCNVPNPPPPYTAEQPDDRPIWVTGNVITGYANRHAPGTTDGITNFCSNVTIADNDIIDTTDVGIVLFRVPPGTAAFSQKSKVYNNEIVQVGNQAWGALALDGMAGGYQSQWSFDGCEVHHNLAWTDMTGPETSPTFSRSTWGKERISPHFVIGIAVGTRAWFGDGSLQILNPSIHDNTVKARVTMGIAIHVASGQTVTNNTLDIQLHRFWLNDCPMAAQSAPPDPDVSGCIYRETSMLYKGGMLTKPSPGLPPDYGQRLLSSNGSYVLVHQYDGNVVLYRIADGAPIWWTGTSSSSVLYMQEQDGNLVLYGSPGPWNSGTYGHPGAMLKVHNDGYLVIVDGSGAAIARSCQPGAPFAATCPP